jgi:pimeloyl-ACP methyl ester carboxylesterase
MAKSLHTLMKRWCLDQNIHYLNHGFDRGDADGYVDAVLMQPSGESKGLVVFAHGTGNDLFYPQISLFKAVLSAGYTIFTFDLDGHGLSSSTIFRPDEIYSCLEKSVDQAQQAAPGLPIHLIGHSLGGAVALKYLANFPVKIESGILISVPLFVPQTVGQLLGELTSLKSRSVYQQVSHYGVWNLLPAFGRFKRHLYPIRLESNPPRDDRPMGYLQEITKAFEVMDLAEAATGVDIPILLIYGDHDQIAPLAHGETLFESLSSCELFVVPGETHFTTILSPQCEGKIISWLNKH